MGSNLSDQLSHVEEIFVYEGIQRAESKNSQNPLYSLYRLSDINITRAVLCHSQAEWEPLLKSSGFELKAVHPTRGYYKVLLAAPMWCPANLPVVVEYISFLKPEPLTLQCTCVLRLNRYWWDATCLKNVYFVKTFCELTRCNAGFITSIILSSFSSEILLV